LDEKSFDRWAVQKIASDILIEQKEEFAERFPPEELRQVYGVLDREVMHILAANGIPISREDLFKMFRSWFVRTASPKRNGFGNNPTTEQNQRQARLGWADNRYPDAYVCIRRRV
jgi:hypothetical protein